MLLILLLQLATPVERAAGGPIGNRIVIADGPEQEVNPAVAYNSERQEYLVVWYNDRPGCDDIRARRVARNGTLIDGPFYISAGCPAERRYPDVVYNSAHDQYLVVWEQSDPTSGNSIQGRRISGTGGVMDQVDITIRGPGHNLYTPGAPAVAYASASDRYLVVWAETWHPMPITHGVTGQVVTEAGALEGSWFTIAQGSAPHDSPDLAYNRHANRYLVVWQEDESPGGWDIEGQQVHGGGGLYHGGITITNWGFHATNPAVAAIPTAPGDWKFLVVYEVGGIFGDRVGEDGSVPQTRVDVSEPFSGGGRPAIAGTEIGFRYFVAWSESQGTMDNPIVGQKISHDGWRLGSCVDFSGVDADLPAVVAGPGGTFLVVWQDQPAFATNKNIYGRLVGTHIHLPMLLRHAR